MDAARGLLVDEGPDGLTIDAVVTRSGVARSTVYRHWRTRDDLVTDVFVECMPRLESVGDEVGAVDALRGLTRQLARALADPQWQRLLPALILLRSRSDALADLDDEMRSAQQDLVTEVFRRAVDERVLDAEVLVDPRRTGLVLVGPLLALALVDGDGIDEDFVDEVVDRFVRAYAPQ